MFPYFKGQKRDEVGRDPINSLTSRYVCQNLRPRFLFLFVFITFLYLEVLDLFAKPELNLFLMGIKFSFVCGVV